MGYFKFQKRVWPNFSVWIIAPPTNNFFFLIFTKHCIGEGNGTSLQYSCLGNPWMEEPGKLQSMGSLKVTHDWATSLLFTFHFHALEKEMATTPVFLPGESQGWEPGGLPSMRSHRVGHDRRDLAAALYRASQVVKNPPANAGDIRDTGLIPESGRSPGGGQGNPLQYSCLENPKDRRAWGTAVHSAAKSQT